MTFWTFILGLLLLAVPFAICYIYEVKIERQLLAGLARLLGVMALTGLALYFIFKWNSIWVSLLVFILMVVAASVATITNGRLSRQTYFVPVLAGMSASALIVGGWLLLVAGLSGERVLDVRWLIPVTGLLMGSLIGLNSQALAGFYKGFQHHSALYYYLLGNGATHSEAMSYLVRRALQQSALPVVRRMAAMVTAQAPIVVWGMLMAGVDVWTAVAWQVLLLVAVLAAAMLSVAVALWVAGKGVKK